MSRKQILWLCSWYPCKTDPFNGDFIQRHARAASLYNDIYVLYVAGDDTGSTNHKEETITRTNGLTEQLISFKKKKGVIGKMIARYRWAKLFRRAIRGYIASHGRPHAVHVQVPMKAGIPALWIKRKYNIPFVVTEHWGIYNDIAPGSYLTKNAAFRYCTRKIIAEAAAFIPVSHYLAKGINEMVVEKTYTVIPNVADTSLFFYRPKQDGPFRFIHVSNMVPLKNTEGILRAFKQFAEKNQDVELVLVGNRDDAMKHYASSLGMQEPQVTFKGEVAYEEVAAAMQQSDCLLLFSNIENSPCVIGEALCCGLPLVVTNTGGIPELVDESNALLIPPQDEAALLTAMQQMSGRQTIYHRKAIADRASEKFSYEVVGRQLDAVYGQL